MNRCLPKAPLCKGGCRLRLGDCNLHEQSCLRCGQRTEDYNPSVTSLPTPPLAQGRLFVCGRDEGRKYTSPSCPPGNPPPLKGRQGGKNSPSFVLMHTRKSLHHGRDLSRPYGFYCKCFVEWLAERAAPEGAFLRMLLCSVFAVKPMGVQVSPVKRGRFQTEKRHSGQ